MVYLQRVLAWLFLCAVVCAVAFSVVPNQSDKTAGPRLTHGNQPADLASQRYIPSAPSVPLRSSSDVLADNGDVPASVCERQPLIFEVRADHGPLPVEQTASSGQNTEILASTPDTAQSRIDETDAEPVEPAEKIGLQASDELAREDDVGVEKANEPPDQTVAAESVNRLPMVVANVPSSERGIAGDAVRPLEEMFYPDTTDPHRLSKMQKVDSERTGAKVAAIWQPPQALLDNLRELSQSQPTRKWAEQVADRIEALGAAMSGGKDESSVILAELIELNRKAANLAGEIADRLLARKLRKTGYALGRRIDIWEQIVLLDAPRAVEPLAPQLDPQKLAFCLSEVASLTGDSDEGKAWRNYLLVDALRDSSAKRTADNQDQMRRLAQQVLARLTQNPLSPNQRKFIASAPICQLRDELRHWAAEPIDATGLLRDLERYEHSGLPSDARRLAADCQYLTAGGGEVSSRLAERIDLHYRNANLRIAVTEELLNRLIPERNLEYAPVSDRILGRRVRGESLMASEVTVRMLPDPNRVRMALEVTGEIASMTTAEAGPARFHSDSEAYYIASKPLEINMQGISLWPAEVSVANHTRLRGVETPLDWVPVVGAGAKWVAKSQMEQNKPAANREVRQKVASQAKQRIDDEVRQQLGEVVERMNRQVFGPLNSLSLDPQLVAAETTEKRFIMRLRLAGEDQLGSHTPRPQAPADSLASVQVHESVLNNGIQRMQLCGRTFTLPQLSQHIAARLNRPTAWEISPDQADVKITFAEKDSVVVRCQDGQLVLTLSIAQLSKPPRKWTNFQIRAFYKPEVNGRSAQLVRDGVIHLIGQRLHPGAQIALRGIFTRALSKNNSWELVPEQIVTQPKLENAAITQFVIDDGWIGVSLGPKPSISTAHRPNVRRMIAQ